MIPTQTKTGTERWKALFTASSRKKTSFTRTVIRMSFIRKMILWQLPQLT